MKAAFSSLYSCAGGEIVLPAPGAALVDREDGGNLIVNPPRPVWERSALDRDELAAWACLVAATGGAMLAALPQLENGCVNYWEAGNWALHPRADPLGPKWPIDHRRVHLHLLGRSRHAASPDLQWGEAPRFPLFSERLEWAASHRPLRPDECVAIVAGAVDRLRRQYGLPVPDLETCGRCGYPRTDRHQCRSIAD